MESLDTEQVLFQLKNQLFSWKTVKVPFQCPNFPLRIGGVPSLRPYIYNTIHLLEKFAVQNCSKLSPMRQITEEENTRRCRHYSFVHKPAIERDGGGEELHHLPSE
jgi:hypothetical protein